MRFQLVYKKCGSIADDHVAALRRDFRADANTVLVGDISTAG
jgi:hypothetical protein